MREIIIVDNLGGSWALKFNENTSIFVIDPPCSAETRASPPVPMGVFEPEETAKIQNWFLSL